MVAAERRHQPEGDDDDAGAERPDVDERALADGQGAEHDERDRHRVRGGADHRVEPVCEPAADVAAVPAEVENAAEEEPERDRRQPPELGVLLARARLLRRPPLLDATRELRTQLRLPLAGRHAPVFARRTRVPSTPESARRRACRSTSAPRRRARRRGHPPRPRPGAREAARASRPSPPRRRAPSGVKSTPVLRQRSPGAVRRRAPPPESNPYGPSGSWACPWSALAISPTRVPCNRLLLGAVARLIAAPARTCSSMRTSRAGLTTTTRGAWRKSSGTSVPQSSGISASAGSLPPYETPSAGMRSSRRARRIASARSRSVSCGPTRADVTTARWPSTCTVCGVTTTSVSRAARSQRRPSSSIAARNSGARSTSPWGAIAANAITAAFRGASRAARGSAPRRRRRRLRRSGRAR